MKHRSRIRALLILLAAAGLLMAGPSGQFVYDLRQGRRVELSELAPELRKSRIVVVGEQHTDEGHHRAQLKVIQALVQAGAKIAVGLEMKFENRAWQCRFERKIGHGCGSERIGWEGVGAGGSRRPAAGGGWFVIRGRS